jgi:hypothetical protein
LEKTTHGGDREKQADNPRTSSMVEGANSTIFSVLLPQVYQVLRQFHPCCSLAVVFLAGRRFLIAIFFFRSNHLLARERLENKVRSTYGMRIVI